VFEKVDDNLRDANGYNLEAGYRGMSGYLRWDLSLFQLRYNNRLGMLVKKDGDGDAYYLRTNIGNSVTRGAELFVEYFLPFDNLNVSLFSSTAWQDARYKKAHLRVGDENVDIHQNKVESAPDIITRNGLNIRLPKGSISVLYSYTAKSYADALNTETPSASGAVGLVPAYSLIDINSTWKVTRSFVFRFNVNNVMDKNYFTKRPQFYPGPGIWPSDGRSFVATFGFSL
jgi:Fe(3+) dicitrate transport protein